MQHFLVALYKSDFFGTCTKIDNDVCDMAVNKALKDMTMQELWQMFPIVLTHHNPYWKIWADEEIESLSGLLAMFSPKISHIGSTAVPGISAKPIVDIAKEYETLKLSLLPEYRNNRDGYTEAKTAFVKRITYMAKHHIKRNL